MSGNGGSKSGGSKSGGNNKPAAKKKSNGTSKYFKKTSTPKAKTTVPPRHRDAYVAPKAKKKVIATSIGSSSKPAGHPSSNKNATIAIKAKPKGGLPHASTIDASKSVLAEAAKSGALTPAKPAKDNPLSIGDKENKQIDSSFAIKAKSTIKAPISVDAEYDIQTRARDEQIAMESKKAPAIPLNTKAAVKPPPSINYNTDDASETTKSKQLAPKPKPVGDPTLNQSTSAPVTAAPKLINKDIITDSAALRKQIDKATVDKETQTHTRLVQKYQGQKTELNNFNQASYNDKAASQKAGNVLDVINPFREIIKDKYRNDETSYNQAYWKAKRDGNSSQADMAAEQKALGMKKAYSGDRVITQEDTNRAQYTHSSLKKSGIKPTVTSETSGLLGENTTKTSSYDIGTGKPIVVTDKSTSPTIGGFRLGADKGTSFVDGVAAYNRTGQGDTLEVSRAKRKALGDQAKIEPMDNLNTVNDIQDAIEKTTNKKELAALHRRLRALMRSNRTRTQFGGLKLGEADVKATQLGTRIK